MSNKKAIEKWYKQQTKKMINKYEKNLGNKQDAEDCFHNLTLKLLENKSKWSKISKKNHDEWTYKEFLRNRTITRKRNKESIKDYKDIDSLNLVCYNTPEYESELSEFKQYIELGIGSIDEYSLNGTKNHYRECFIEKYLNELEINEIKKHINLAEVSIRRQCNKGYEQFIEELKKYYL